MGHRALVAYRQADGTFTLHYAHWGRRLAEAIEAETPVGGPAEAPDLTTDTAHLDVDPREGARAPVETRVDTRPLVERVPAEGVLDAIDANYESLVVVEPTCEATELLVCSLDPGPEGTTLVLADPDGDPEELRRWFIEVKSRLSAAVASGTIIREAARETLRRALSGRATVYPMDDASFLRDG